ncbi:heterokaryon incompatibility protein-domain-containing protein [Flammula alnicola]|nr:heterokaryon incompatibility protein-domain-containing protein [Flammula alnicola]
MKLCSKCLSIPFENPPPLPKNYSDSLPGLPENDDLYYVEHRDTHSRPPHTFGHPHYQSEPELKTSAQNCQLCRLILREFHRIIASVQHPLPTYCFLITRREGKQDGFVVWTSGHDGSIWRVGAYGYCVKDATDPLSSVFKGREIEKDPSATNPGPFKVAEEWIHDCIKHHRLCGPRSPNPLLPTRVIDVGTSSSSVIKLLDTKGKFRGPYTLLSYSWGPPPHDYQTTLSNHSSYQTAIIFPKGKVPKTIVDAIELTRMLGIQYLWVDALCIIQDDAADWATESARMADYYGNGYLTITAAASKDAYMGCFLPRAPQSSARFHYITNSGIGGELTVFALPPEKENIQANYVVFEAEPITGRGWTLQERVLTT